MRDYKVERILYSENRVFYVPSIENDFHTQYGYIKKSDLKKRSGIVKTNLGKKFFIMPPSYRDLFERLLRGPQIITIKDISIIAFETGINKNSVVVDAGTGSGALAIMLSLISKRVISYEIRKEFYNIALKNKQLFGLKNLILKNKDLKQISEKNVDVIVLDMPQPWDYLEECISALKIGGYLVTYLPNVNQVMKNIEEQSKFKNLIHVKTLEVLSREWLVNEKQSRPKTEMLGHTGFITISRRII
ncbi:MAG: methyltransferase domain-containing protein [Candidatus Woesearchaeota archaeon]